MSSRVGVTRSLEPRARSTRGAWPQPPWTGPKAQVPRPPKAGWHTRTMPGARRTSLRVQVAGSAGGGYDAAHERAGVPFATGSGMRRRRRTPGVVPPKVPAMSLRDVYRALNGEWATVQSVAAKLRWDDGLTRVALKALASDGVAEASDPGPLAPTRYRMRGTRATPGVRFNPDTGWRTPVPPEDPFRYQGEAVSVPPAVMQGQPLVLEQGQWWDPETREVKDETGRVLAHIPERAYDGPMEQEGGGNYGLLGKGWEPGWLERSPARTVPSREVREEAEGEDRLSFMTGDPRGPLAPEADRFKGQPRPLDGLVCSNCGKRIQKHCRVHVVPCCPGKCGGEVPENGANDPEGAKPGSAQGEPGGKADLGPEPDNGRDPSTGVCRECGAGPGERHWDGSGDTQDERNRCSFWRPPDLRGGPVPEARGLRPMAWYTLEVKVKLPADYAEKQGDAGGWEGLGELGAALMVFLHVDRMSLDSARMVKDRPVTMFEVGVEGDLFNPHPFSTTCSEAGCIPAPPVASLGGLLEELDDLAEESERHGTKLTEPALPTSVLWDLLEQCHAAVDLGDHEVAHSLEDQLHVKVIEAIAEGHPRARMLARISQVTRAWPIKRWSA